MSKEEIVEFKDIYKGDLDSDGQLGDYAGKTLIIKGIEFGAFETLGNYAIVTCQHGNENKKLHTFSKTLIKQLKRIEPILKQGKAVKAKLVKRKNYYTFE